MKIIFDEHVSPRIVRALGDNARLLSGWTLETVVQSKYASIEDEDWFFAFQRDGGNAIISADRKMLKRATLLSTISSTGLISVYLPAEFAEGRRMFQLAYLAFWWDEIAVALGSSQKGWVWVAPRNIGRGAVRRWEPSNRQRNVRTAGS